MACMICAVRAPVCDGQWVGGRMSHIIILYQINFKESPSRGDGLRLRVVNCPVNGKATCSKSNFQCMSPAGACLQQESALPADRAASRQLLAVRLCKH